MRWWWLGLGLILLVPSRAGAAAAGSMGFDPASKIIKAGEEFRADIIIDTQGNAVAGAGAKISYDPGVIWIKEVVPGRIFGDYPIAAFDNNTGKASLSGIITSPDNLFTGTGTLGSVVILGKEEGIAIVKIEFTPGDTTDSNLAVTYEPGDILTQVKNLTVRVEENPEGQSSATVPVNSLESVTPTPTPKTGFLAGLIRTLGLSKQKENQADTTVLTGSEPNRDPNPSQPEESREPAAAAGKVMRAGLIAAATAAAALAVFVGIRIWRRYRKSHPGNVLNQFSK